MENSSESDRYWEWDRCRWGSHRVSCYPGNCPYRVYAKDGRVIREEISCSYPEFSDPSFRVPDFNPRGCQKGVQHSRSMYGPDRVLYPMKRVGERGGGRWQRISWAEAFDEIGARLADVIVKHGPQAFLDDHGNNGIGFVRGGSEASGPALAGLLGGVSFDMNFMVGDFPVGQYLTFGQIGHSPGIETWFLPDTIVLLSNPVYSNIPDVHYFLEARYRGAKLVVIAPDKSPTAQFADVWVPINWSADPSLWLGVCRILIENGWIDEQFMKEQTDLPVLVRSDDKRFLREADLRNGGDAEQFYAFDASGTIVPLPKDTLRMSADYALDGTQTVRLKDGKEIGVTTVFHLLKDRVADYTPEKVHEQAGAHPETLQQIAELCRPPRKVFVFANWIGGKLYHGDLIERGYCYMLALTGNVGKPGAGTRGFAAGVEMPAAMSVVIGMPKSVLESENPIAESGNMFQMLLDDYRNRVKMDPTMPPYETASGGLREALRFGATLAPPIFLWYHHAGYRQVWDRHLDDPNACRKISEYADEAIRQGWWKGFERPAKDVTPRALYVTGGNPLRRHRGGMNTYFKTMWPKLDLVVVVEPRWSTTALFGDYVLPAASHYEYADTSVASPHNRFVVLTDQTVPMRGESKSDRQIILGIAKSVERHLKERGVERYPVEPGGREIVVDEIYWRATYGGRYGDSNEDEERLVDDVYRALSDLGWVTSVDGEAVGLENLRGQGKAWLSGRPSFNAMVAQGSDLVPGEIHCAFRDQLEQKVPYSTTTRRIQFYVDHPWFVEADEHLVRYKEPPYIAGRHPLRLTSGHLRWSIHANWVTSEEMLKLHRGEPFAFINDRVAREKRIRDHDYIRVFNDYGSFFVRAKLSPCVRPDQLVIYHAWDPYQYAGWKSYDTLLPGPPKGLQFAGGYRHFEYTLWNWAPSQSDRQTNVSFERADPDLAGESPGS
jgi:DMSO reductase family type II enzyme molybdopterin subunit